MLGTYFYHKTIRKMVVLFGTIFNDIWVKRTNNNDVVVEQMKVPVSYGSKGKFLTRLNQDPTLTKQTAITTPRIGFEITGLTYDPVRKLNTLGTSLKKGTDAGTLKKQYNPVPYNFDVGCYILVRNQDDGTQIMEQILPHFTPEFTVTITQIADMGIKTDIPIILNSATVEDQYEGDFATRRAIVWSLAFMMKGFIYPDIKDNSAVIKKVVTDLHLAGSGQAVGEPIRLLLEDSTLQTSNYVLLDNDPNETSSVVKFITEDSPEGASTGVVSRLTLSAGEQNVDDPAEDFGFTTDRENFDFPREWNSGTNSWESL